MLMIFHLMMKTFPEIPGDPGSKTLSVSNISGIELPLSEEDLHQIAEIFESDHHTEFREVEAVFVDEAEIVRINREHLGRDYVTDIISFNYNEPGQPFIEGTLFCCARRIEEQSAEFQTVKRDEFLRVVIHGFIHLMGFDDQTPQDKEIMTRMENQILQRINKGSH